MGKDNKVNIVLSLSTIVLLDISFMVYSIANVSFTTIPAILGTGLVTILFAMGNLNKKKRRLVYLFVCVIYIVVMIHRVESAYVILCFILLGILWDFTKKYRNEKKKGILRYVIVCAGFVAGTLCINGLNNIVLDKLNGPEFKEFNEARTLYMDYAHDSYSMNPELYESVGWDEVKYELVQRWCFMDDDVTAETLTYLSENSIVKESTITLAEITVKSALADRGCRMLICVFGLSVVLLLICIAFNFQTRFFFFACLNNIGALLLVLYQILTARLLYRSLFVVILPTVVINCVIMSFMNRYMAAKAHRVLCIVAIFGGCLCSGVVLDFTFNVQSNTSKKYMSILNREVEDYVIEHSDEVFIYDFNAYNKFDMQSVDDDESLTNLIAWGGSEYNSDGYKKRLELNGIDSLSGDITQRDNVRMLFKQNLVEGQAVDNTEIPALFYLYLQENFGAMGFVIEDDIEQQVYVYRYVYEENKTDYQLYYTVENGKIISKNVK